MDKAKLFDRDKRASRYEDVFESDLNSSCLKLQNIHQIQLRDYYHNKIIEINRE
jgi:hypothetical protein